MVRNQNFEAVATPIFGKKMYEKNGWKSKFSGSFLHDFWKVGRNVKNIEIYNPEPEI